MVHFSTLWLPWQSMWSLSRTCLLGGPLSSNQFSSKETFRESVYNQNAFAVDHNTVRWCIHQTWLRLKVCCAKESYYLSILLHTSNVYNYSVAQTRCQPHSVAVCNLRQPLHSSTFECLYLLNRVASVSAVTRSMTTLMYLIIIL